MPTSARRRQGITGLVAAIAILGACKANRPAARDAVAGPSRALEGSGNVTAPVRDAASAAVADDAVAPDAANHITITVAKPRTPGTGFAKRCAIAGDPLTNDCVGGGEGLVADKAGTLYLVAGDSVRRYRRADGPECRLEPTGEPIALPPDNPRPQVLDGPVYFRSGGPAWHLARLGDAIYAVDFLVGLFRIDRGTPQPACTDVFGYHAVAQLGSRVVTVRKGLEQLVLGTHCRARPAKIDDKARGEVHVVNGTLYTAVAGSGEVTRYDGTAKTVLGGGTRICSATGLTACGDGVCIVDNNCMQLVQIAADGTARVLDDRALFDQRPWHLGDAVTLPDGRVLLLARHRDHTSEKETCEAAVYELPAALFER
jgi:hypothetical protein